MYIIHIDESGKKRRNYNNRDFGSIKAPIKPALDEVTKEHGCLMMQTHCAIPTTPERIQGIYGKKKKIPLWQFWKFFMKKKLDTVGHLFRDKDDPELYKLELIYTDPAMANEVYESIRQGKLTYLIISFEGTVSLLDLLKQLLMAKLQGNENSAWHDLKDKLAIGHAQNTGPLGKPNEVA